jgi:alpha/beta hydrolase fold
VHTLRALMLLYPVTYHPSAGHSSYTENASGYRLEANLMRWFWQQYAPDVSHTDPKCVAAAVTRGAVADADFGGDRGVRCPAR